VPGIARKRDDRPLSQSIIASLPTPRVSDARAMARDIIGFALLAAALPATSDIFGGAGVVE
jgi:hypothetical protein